MSPESEVDDKLAKSMISQARKESQRMFGESDELKSLIEDAAKLLGLELWADCDGNFYCDGGFQNEVRFNPLDPERGDLMKVAMAAGLTLELDSASKVSQWATRKKVALDFTEGDYQSLAIAILRAASAVLKARGEE